MNSLDIAVLVLVALCAFAGYRQGLIHTVYRLVSFFAAILFARFFYSYVARFLRETALFTMIKDSVRAGLNLEGFVTEYVAGQQMEIMEALPWPVSQFSGLLYTWFQPDITEILQVQTLEDYVASFFATIAINGIAIVLVFAFALVVLSMLGAVLDVFGRLPVIRTFNRFGGLAVGIVMGVGISWVCIVVMSIIMGAGANAEVYDMLHGSFIAGTVFDSLMPQLAALP